ncbi:MAG: tRNA lysidine(34) synthetase TilS [Rhodospirillaceae bacterium]|nr:tRNA lysidine(34) synthetase TilS [Rhodospirillaceae bacterium]
MRRAGSNACWRVSGPAPIVVDAAGLDVRHDAQPGNDTSGPVGDLEFDGLMRAADVAPGAPVAVAVSGGGDSMALALLADAWRRRHGGMLDAVTVDHGLRPGSAAEAAQVGAWLGAAGIRHRVLTWDGEKPASGIQAAAREARYGLMTEWARRTGVAHILVAHNLEDQAETFLMRLARGAGMHGLAGMAPVIRRGGVIIHRPLLGVSRARLRQTLMARGQKWIEDPSNDNPAFTRTRSRRMVAGLAGRGIEPARLALLAGQFSSIRNSLDGLAQELTAAGVTWRQAGYAELRGQVFLGAPGAVAVHALRQVLGMVGGRAYPPNTDRLERCLERMSAVADQRPFTLAGCRIIKRVGKYEGGEILICREERQPGERTPVRAGQQIQWRGVFEISLQARDDGAETPVYLGPLGAAGWSEIASKLPAARRRALPYPVRTALPALFTGGAVAEVPHLGFLRAEGGLPGVQVATIRWRQLEFGENGQIPLVSRPLRTI